MSWEKFPKFLGKMTKGICRGWSIIITESYIMLLAEYSGENRK